MTHFLTYRWEWFKPALVRADMPGSVPFATRGAKL
jgi:hypothetical protein